MVSDELGVHAVAWACGPAAACRSPFPAVGAAVLRGLLSGLNLSRPLDEAVSHVLDGFRELDVHPDVPAGLRALADGGLRVVTLTNSSLSQSEVLLDRAGIADLVEQRLSVDDAGRWKPHRDAYAYASAASRSSAARWWRCTPGT